MTHMAFMQAFSKKVTPSILQKREEFWRELVNEVKLLEQKACQYGIHLESLLKVISQKKPRVKTGGKKEKSCVLGIPFHTSDSLASNCPFLSPLDSNSLFLVLYVSLNWLFSLKTSESGHFNSLFWHGWDFMTCCSNFCVPGLTEEPFKAQKYQQHFKIELKTPLENKKLSIPL